MVLKKNKKAFYVPFFLLRHSFGEGPVSYSKYELVDTKFQENIHFVNAIHMLNW